MPLKKHPGTETELPLDRCSLDLWVFHQTFICAHVIGVVEGLGEVLGRRDQLHAELRLLPAWDLDHLALRDVVCGRRTHVHNWSQGCKRGVGHFGQLAMYSNRRASATAIGHTTLKACALKRPSSESRQTWPMPTVVAVFVASFVVTRETSLDGVSPYAMSRVSRGGSGFCEKPRDT